MNRNDVEVTADALANTCYNGNVSDAMESLGKLSGAEAAAVAVTMYEILRYTSTGSAGLFLKALMDAADKG